MIPKTLAEATDRAILRVKMDVEMYLEFGWTLHDALAKTASESCWKTPLWDRVFTRLGMI